jgi:hypothetical protein
VNEGDAGPLVVDWDGDGAHDLIVGAGDGSILFFRNETPSGLPILAAGVELLPRLESTPGRYGGRPSSKNAVGVRVKVHATDWNGDGLLDLLVGDLLVQADFEPTFTEAQKAERKRLEADLEEISEAMRPIYERAERTAREALKLGRDDEVPDERADAYREAWETAAHADPAYAGLARRRTAAFEALRPLEPPDPTHGYVHVLLRMAPK